MQQVIPIWIVLAISLSGCAKKQAAPTYDREDLPPDVAGNTSPSSDTAALNAAVRESLPLSDPQDFEDAKRGLIASDTELRVTTEAGKLIWNMPAYDFVEGVAPVSVNPSLWRQAKLNNIHGLFEVTKGVYQLRGYDLANMSIIEGKTGWIVVDPLTAKETAAKAMAFAREHLADKPISAVIYTHSHIDHFGGVLGIISAEEVEERNVPIIAPEFFLEEATSENVIAGAAMARRSMFMMGPRLPKGERGHVDTGLGKGVAYGTFGLIPPSAIVTETGTEMTIDGHRLQSLPSRNVRTSRGSIVHNLEGGVRLRESAGSIELLGEARDEALEQLVRVAKQRFGSNRIMLLGRKDVQRRLTEIAAECARAESSALRCPKSRGARCSHKPRYSQRRVANRVRRRGYALVADADEPIAPALL